MSVKKQVTEQELLTILMNVNKPTFTNIVSKVDQKMVKKSRIDGSVNPYYEKVKKVTKGNYFIGGNYEDMVNNRMVKEGIEPTFESVECSVGKHISKCVQYNENTQLNYLQYYIFQSSNIKSELFFEGNQIEKQLLESYLPTTNNTSRQPQEDKHIVKSFKLSSIEEITLSGTHYIVKK